MNRRIVWLNLGLLALLGWGSIALRQRWVEASEKEKAVLDVKGTAPAQPAVAQAPAPNPLAASQYFEVADRFLFSKDRNPVVVVEQKAAPPPKPMPELPSVFGVMNLGFGPTVFMAPTGQGQQGYKVGDQVGEFKLTAASSKELTFEWEDKKITRSLDELVAQSRQKTRDGQATVAAAPLSPLRGDTAPAPVVKPPENVKPAPGADIGMGRRGCVPGDSSPQGTVAEGYKKVSYQYAFGPICYWEEAR